MAGFDQQFVNDASSGVRIEVKGLTQVIRHINRFADDAEDMKDLMHSTGNIVAERAKQIVPVVSGRLQKTIRAGRGKTKAVVRAGGRTQAPYAAYVHYPWMRLYMVHALRDRAEEVHAHISLGLADLLKKNALI